MKKQEDSDLAVSCNAYRQIGDKCGLSMRTIQIAFSRKAVTYRTARRIAMTLGIPIACFVIKEDRRGRRGRGKKTLTDDPRDTSSNI